MPAPDDRHARLGQAVHRVLQWAVDAAAAAHNLAELAGAASAEFGVADAMAVEAVAANILHSPDCARFFDVQSIAWAGNEVPVAGTGAAAGAVLRIDRLVQTNDAMPTWWVLDYKLDAAPQLNPDYLAQLAAYGQAVQALQPGQSVRCAFITASGEVIEPG